MDQNMDVGKNFCVYKVSNQKGGLGLQSMIISRVWCMQMSKLASIEMLTEPEILSFFAWLGPSFPWIFQEKSSI